MGKSGSEGIKISAGQATYFLDVKEAKTGSKYLVLSESRRNKEGKYDRQRIVIFSNHFTEILDALKKAGSELGVS